MLNKSQSLFDDERSFLDDIAADIPLQSVKMSVAVIYCPNLEQACFNMLLPHSRRMHDTQDGLPTLFDSRCILLVHEHGRGGPREAT